MDHGVDAARHALDYLDQADRPHRLPHFLVGCVGAGKGDVVAHRAGEQERLLGDDPELPAQRTDGDMAQVVTVDQDSSAGRVIETGDQLRHR